MCVKNKRNIYKTFIRVYCCSYMMWTLNMIHLKLIIYNVAVNIKRNNYYNYYRNKGWKGYNSWYKWECKLLLRIIMSLILMRYLKKMIGTIAHFININIALKFKCITKNVTLYLSDIIHKFLTYMCVYISRMNLKVVNCRTGKIDKKYLTLEFCVYYKKDIYQIRFC